MSANAATSATPPAPTPETRSIRPPVEAGLDWGLIGRQITGILRLEIGKYMLTRRALALYILAFAPAVLIAFWAIHPIGREELGGPAGGAGIFANFFPFYLRGSVFLSALLLFMSLFRAEILEKSLHYYLLTPIRREVLAAGKYLSALIAMAITFALSTTVMFLLIISPWGLGELSSYLFNGPGLGNLMAYFGIAMLGCAGYGAVFLLMGQFFKNPVIPGAFLLGWELINFLLPPLLKKVSVIHYLRSLYPIPVEEGPFAIIADPTPAWISIPGLLIFTALVLATAGWRARRMEVSYGGE